MKRLFNIFVLAIICFILPSCGARPVTRLYDCCSIDAKIFQTLNDGHLALARKPYTDDVIAIVTKNGVLYDGLLLSGTYTFVSTYSYVTDGTENVAETITTGNDTIKKIMVTNQREKTVPVYMRTSEFNIAVKHVDEINQLIK